MKIALLFITLLTTNFSKANHEKSHHQQGKTIRNFTIVIGNSLMALGILGDMDPALKIGATSIGALLTLSTLKYTTPEDAHEKIWGNIKKLNDYIVGHCALDEEFDIPREEQLKRKYRNP